MHKTLTDANKIVLPRLPINIGLMKKLVKPLPKDGECFKCLYEKFVHLSELNDFFFNLGMSWKTVQSNHNGDEKMVPGTVNSLNFG